MLHVGGVAELSVRVPCVCAVERFQASAVAWGVRLSSFWFVLRVAVVLGSDGYDTTLFGGGKCGVR